jgi:TRAP-type C4-dicarboxylate transport system substrate-binding protein
MLFLVNLFFIGLTVKFASIAPEGSFWYDMALKIKQELEKDQSIKIVVYSGTAMGDEADIVRKLRIGQLHAAGLTSHGLEMISPEIRAYDIPLVFNSWEEFFEVRTKLFPELARRYERKGYKLLSHFAIGFVYIFSKSENIWGSNLWVWIGDTLSEAQAKELQGTFKIVPLQIIDVLQALATGIVDTVFNTFYALHALQWSKFIKSYIPMPQYIYSAGIIVRKDIWDKIPEETKRRGEKFILENSLSVEEGIVKLEKQVQEELSKKVRVENDPKKIEELKNALEKIRKRVIESNPEIKDFYALIDRELTKIRSSKK